MPDDMMFKREEKPYGITWEEWTIKWWLWLLSIRKDINPALDSTGQKFHPTAQCKGVIFLPGTLDGEHAERHYTLPGGRAILFPVINFTTSYVEEPSLKTESDLILRAERDISSIVDVDVVIDGKRLEEVHKFRVQSPVFDLVFRHNNVFGFEVGATKAISDGYWIFLKPLRSGPHDIFACGSCYSGRTKESIIWHLKIADSPTNTRRS